MTEKRKQSKLREYITRITRITNATNEAEMLSAEQAFEAYINLAATIAKRSLQNDQEKLDE